MLKIALAGVVAAGVGIGLLWPASKAESSNGLGAVHELVIGRSADGHYYADAEVNGAPVRFLIDTGTTTIALSQEDAKKAGIAFSPSEFELIGQGASGMVRGKDVTLGKIAFNGVEQADAKAAVVEGTPTSLLGAQFLDTMDEIVIRKGEMTLRKRG